MVDVLLESDLARRLGWVLVHSVWQLAAVAVAARVAFALLRSHSPSTRYATACAAMAAMGVPLVATFLSAGREASSHPGPPSATVGAAPPIVRSPGDLPMPLAPVFDPPSVVPNLAVASPYLGWVVGAWLVGAGVATAWVIGGWAMTRRLRRAGMPAADFDGHLVRVAARLEVRRSVRLLESSRVEVPVTLGWRRPVILVPTGLLAGLSPAERDAVLAHELAHIRRRDYPANLAQVLVEAALFFHPAVWWLSRRVRTEREFCCDDLGVLACGGPIPYAKALAAVASGHAPAVAVAILGRSESMVVHRVRRVLEPDNGPRKAGRVGLAVSIGLLLMVVGSLAVANPPMPKAVAPAEKDKAKAAAPPDKAAAPKAAVLKSVRQNFRPTTTASGKTSWNGLFAPAHLPRAGDKSLMMIAHAHRGDRWPVGIAGEKVALFHAELIDGDEKQVEIKVVDGGKDRKVVLKLDKPETVDVGGKSFEFSCGTTEVAGTEPQDVDYAVLIVTLKRK